MSLRTTKAKIRFFIIDFFDFFYRLFTNQNDIPPYSLRVFVGGAKGFKNVGPWFLNDLKALGFLKQGTRILDIGCGCGRLSYTFSKDKDLIQNNISYVGMDIDRQCIKWCSRNISSQNENFSFFHADLKNKTYNPHGTTPTSAYTFPYADNSFDLIIMTSVFTHLVDADLRRFIQETTRMISQDGTIYASFFTYKDKTEAVEGVERRPFKFIHYNDTFAVADDKYPEGAIAYNEQYLTKIFEENGLTSSMPPRYGLQDLFFLRKKT
jgi:SAM-dependent methyltransferase